MNENSNNKPKINVPKPNLSWLYVVIAMVFAFLWFSSDEGSANKEITYTEFKDMQAKLLHTTITRLICISSLNILLMSLKVMQIK